MPARRRISLEEGHAAVREWAEGEPVPRQTLATAVRFTLEELATRAPGKSVEVRVPPFGVVQCMPGPAHTRGTPPNVIETDAQTWLELATGRMPWDAAITSGRVRASGLRATLADWLPLLAPRDATARGGAGEAF